MEGEWGEREKRYGRIKNILCVRKWIKKETKTKKKQKTNTVVIVRVGKSVIKTTISKSR